MPRPPSSRGQALRPSQAKTPGADPEATNFTAAPSSRSSASRPFVSQPGSPPHPCLCFSIDISDLHSVHPPNGGPRRCGCRSGASAGTGRDPLHWRLMDRDPAVMRGAGGCGHLGHAMPCCVGPAGCHFPSRSIKPPSCPRPLQLSFPSPHSTVAIESRRLHSFNFFLPTFGSLID